MNKQSVKHAFRVHKGKGVGQHTLRFPTPQLLCTVAVSPLRLKEQMLPLFLIVACFWTLSPKNSQTGQATDSQC
jgi:hypothetical protein